MSGRIVVEFHQGMAPWLANSREPSNDSRVIHTRSGPIDYPREKPKNPKGLLNRAALSCDARKLVEDGPRSTFFQKIFVL